jgi:hypothetical protein
MRLKHEKFKVVHDKKTNILAVLLLCRISLLHRKLQEDLTDEMVDLARQLKESSMLMNQSVQDTDKVDFSVALALFLLWRKFPQFQSLWMY